MEIANLVGTVRQAVKGDAAGITALLQRAACSHVHVDWQLPVEWIGTPGFVVWEETRARATLTGLVGTRLRACLAATADPLPAAWVRAAALDEIRQPERVLAEMLGAVTRYLARLGVTELAWLAAEEWPDNYAPGLGFRQAYAIISYMKDSLTVPPFREAAMTIRPVQDEDFGQLADLEASAFEPIWRHSATALRLAWRQALSFDVAERDGQPVAFQYSVLGQSGLTAHLVRMTVRPELQGQGIGSTLLAHAVEGYRRHGLGGVSLNTQSNNYRSQRLYEKFGFRLSGDELPIWVMALQEPASRPAGDG
jgi:ribosomal-protein-alanine N-acetyltransferase